jgi:Cfr10I/Bse634I restriction endonuclease
MNHSWFTEIRAGKYQINSIQIYSALRHEIAVKIHEDVPVSEIIQWISEKTKSQFLKSFQSKPETGALNNSIGRWNEFITTSLLCDLSINMYDDEQKIFAVFSLPNSTVKLDNSPEFLKLFTKDSLLRLSHYSSQIFFPSPDYVVVTLGDSSIAEQVRNLMATQIENPESLEIFNFLKGKLEFEDVKSVISLKTSNRSDRRYQPSFEAAMIKAIGYFTGVTWKYYMVTGELRPADRVLFDNVISPHSIALGTHENLVDGIFVYQRKSDLITLVKAAIQ